MKLCSAGKIQRPSCPSILQVLSSPKVDVSFVSRFRDSAVLVHQRNSKENRSIILSVTNGMHSNTVTVPTIGIMSRRFEPPSPTTPERYHDRRSSRRDRRSEKQQALSSTVVLNQPRCCSALGTESQEKPVAFTCAGGWRSRAVRRRCHRKFRKTRTCLPVVSYARRGGERGGGFDIERLIRSYGAAGDGGCGRNGHAEFTSNYRSQPHQFSYVSLPNVVLSKSTSIGNPGS